MRWCVWGGDIVGDDGVDYDGDQEGVEIVMETVMVMGMKERRRELITMQRFKDRARALIITATSTTKS